MSGLLPARRDNPRRNLELAARATSKAELEVFRHRLAATARGQMEQIDREVLGDVLRTALTEEVHTLHYGLSLADGDPAIIELTAKKLALQEAIDNRRISRTFGA